MRLKLLNWWERKKTQVITARLVQHPFLRKAALRLVVLNWELWFQMQNYNIIPERPKISSITSVMLSV